MKREIKKVLKRQLKGEPDIIIESDKITPLESAKRIFKLLKERGIIS